jgi:phosphatidyl-myo-inositol dimannoside synthase
VRWLKFCERIVANSNNTAALAESKGVATERLTVIPPGVRSDRFSISTDVVATKQSWNIEDKKIILFVGRLAKRKGIKEFIENSLLEIVREIPNTVFLIVGDNPTESLTHREDMVGEIKATVSKTELVSHVRLLGCLSDDEVIKLYHASDVVVLPALEASNDVEGFAIVALEAAAAGKPVVATRVGGIPDAIEDGKSGVLVEPGAYTCFSKVITSLLKDREFGLLKGQYGRCRVSKEFSWQHIIARYQDVFDAVTQ